MLVWVVATYTIASGTRKIFSFIKIFFFCLGTEVPGRSAGIDRPTVDETESTQVGMHLRKTSSHLRHAHPSTHN